MSQSLSALLQDFSAPPPNPDAPVDDAYAQGVAQGRADAEAAHAEAMKAERAAADERLEAARAEWTEAQADRLAEAWMAALTTLEARLAGHLASALWPFLEGHLRLRTLEELAGAITRLSAAGDALPLRVTGPPDLLDALKARLDAIVVDMQADDEAIEVTVTSGDTTIETGFAEWLDRLAEPTR